ncbi:MAG: HEPN domain-containing protein [bacterium]
MPPIFPIHIQRLSDNLLDVRALVQIHEKISGLGPGYEHYFEVLNKSAIVLIVACWEAYVEDLASFSFDRILADVPDPKKWPQNVFALATKEIFKSNKPSRLLELTGNGWINLLKHHRDNTIRRLHTPNAIRVDSLFDDLIGLPSLSSNWHWQGRSNEAAKKRLHDLLQLRHSIVHTVIAPKRIFKWNVSAAVDLINRLAVISSNRVREYLARKVNVTPWLPARVGKI